MTAFPRFVIMLILSSLNLSQGGFKNSTNSVGLYGTDSATNPLNPLLSVFSVLGNVVNGPQNGNKTVRLFISIQFTPVLIT